MSNITYNKKEEAFELPYKIWDEVQTVRFYVEDESVIMENLSAIAGKLAELDGGKKKIAQLLVDDGVYEGHTDTLGEILTVSGVYVDIDSDGDDTEIVVCFTADSGDGYMKPASVELYGDQFEITSVGE
ncbi:MAG TPA: hypothetical protein DCZ71_07035 [Ruminococcus sp.]|nr:hypothetical protein [Ruminococcus sp.]